MLGGHQHLGQQAPGLVQPEVGGLDQAAAQDHHVGVEDGHEVGHADRGPPGEPGHDRRRLRVARPACGDDVLTADGCGVAAHRRQHVIQAAGFGRVAGHPGQAGTGGVALPATAAPTGARWTGRVDHRVTRFPGHPVGPAHHLAAHHQAGTDAGAERDQDDVVVAPGRPRAPFGPHGAVPVVVDHHPAPEAVGQARRGRPVPARRAGWDRDAGRLGGRPGRPRRRPPARPVRGCTAR